MERENPNSPLREEIEGFLRDKARASLEDGPIAWQFAQRIRNGEVTGDYISDSVLYSFLTGLETELRLREDDYKSEPHIFKPPDLSGIVEKLQRDESNVREIEAKLEGHVGEEIFVKGRAFGRLRRWVYRLGRVEASKLDFTIDEEGYSRLTIKTGEHVNRHQNHNPVLASHDIPVNSHWHANNYVVGKEAVADLQKDSWYGRFYPEMAALLQQSLAMRSSV